MPYIGKTELKSSDVIVKSFDGDGSTTTFTLSKVPPSTIPTTLRRNPNTHVAIAVKSHIVETIPSTQNKPCI